MKFNAKTKYILLVLLAIINIVIRFPVTEHALGIDTFYVYGIAESISTFGYARWILNPASFFGLYPYSYPSAFIFMLFGLSQTTGISIDIIILILGIILGIFGAFSMFLLAKEVWNNEIFSFLAAFTFSLSPNFIVFTYWSASTRGLFMALLPFFLWLLLRYYKSLKLSLLLWPIFFIILVASHRVSLLLPLIIVAFSGAYIYNWLSKKVNLKFLNNPDILQVHIFYILAIISSILFIIQFLNIGPFDVKDYYTGYLMEGNDFFSSSVNMAANYSGKLGLIFLFFIPGFIALIGKKNKKFSEMVLIFSAIVFLPFMGIEDYAPIFILPIFILISVTGFIFIFKLITKNKSLMKIISSIFIVLSIIFVLFMLNHWNVYERELSENTFNSAQFIKLNANGTVISNSGNLASQITAYSTKPTIPLGGVYSYDQSPGLIIFGFVNGRDLIMQPIQYNELKFSSDTFWIATNAPSGHMDWVNIIQNNYWDDTAQKLLIKYNANLIIKTGNSNRYMYWSERPSTLLESLYNSGNNIYSNGKETIYSVDLY